MAKISYNKLGLKIDDSIEIIEWNEQSIEVKKYLPVSKKLEIMEKVVNATLQADSKQYNVPQVCINLVMEIIYNCTNISFTEKQKEDINKLYDNFVSSGLLDEILVICEKDYRSLHHWIFDILDKIYAQQNSARGILEAMTTDYNNLNFDVEKLQGMISDPENLTLLKDVLSKLG